MYPLSGDYQVPCEGVLVPESVTDHKNFVKHRVRQLVGSGCSARLMTRREKECNEGAAGLLKT